MSRDAVRKLRERHILDRFLNVSAMKPQSVEPCESPDFLLRFNDELIGVEVTEVFRDADSLSLSPRARENITDRIVTRARAIFHERSRRFVHVNVLFCDGVNLQSLNRESVAIRLADLVHAMPLESSHVHWPNDYEDPSLDAIAFVTALAVPESSMSHWGVARAGWRSVLPTELLRAAIESKDAKVDTYRTKADQLWLLLACEGSRPSQFFDPYVPPAASELASSFDRTYWYNAMHDQFVCWRRSDASYLPPASSTTSKHADVEPAGRDDTGET